MTYNAASTTYVSWAPQPYLPTMAPTPAIYVPAASNPFVVPPMAMDTLTLGAYPAATAQQAVPQYLSQLAAYAQRMEQLRPATPVAVPAAPVVAAPAAATPDPAATNPLGVAWVTAPEAKDSTSRSLQVDWATTAKPSDAANNNSLKVDWVGAQPAAPAAAKTDTKPEPASPAPEPEPAKADPKPAAGPTYTIQPGDSLSLIAGRTLGDIGRWREIYDLNRDQLPNPDVIHPGQVLKLPGGANTAAPAPAPAPKPAPTPAATYTVQSGDSLSAIAGRTLGNMDRWREIYDLNRDQIPNPNVIQVGQVLKLPNGAIPTGPAPDPAGGKWSWPAQGPVTSPFGPRPDPFTGAPVFHNGIDIGAPAGSPVRAPLGGTVVFAGWQQGGGGNFVVVDHGNGLKTAYAHLSAINVVVGQAVGAGALVGKVGSTGNSTGPHLEFQVIRNGVFVNPRQFLA